MDTSEEAKRHQHAHPEGGLRLLDEGEELSTAMKEMFGRIKSQILKGEFHNLLKTPSPARIHSHMSYLKVAAIDLSYCEQFFEEAAKTPDPVERLKLVTTCYVAGHHIGASEMGARVPLNPILGETFQGATEKGSKFYAEQISHHPPITYFYLEGPNDLYTFSGYFEIKAWPTGLSTLNGSREGKQILNFQDGGLISIKDPNMEISGLTYGERI